tara:strand:- start:4298 stop:4690 length:393 start_codon:yes stop_codon:yes gene_type:complete
MVDTASIDVDIDIHQLKEIIGEVVTEALGKVAGADFVATLDTRVNEIGEIQGELFERIERLADDLRRVKLGEDSARFGAQSIAIKNLIRRIAELEAVHGTKCIRTECGSISDGVDGKCMYHSQDDLEAVE